MKISVLAAVLATASGAVAHTHVWSVWVNGVDQGDGRNQYIRSPPNNSPVKDVNSGAIKCNVNDRTVSRWVSAKAGDQITFEWYHDNRGDDILASSHKGPVIVYMAPSSGSPWTKLCQEGLSGGTWATDRLISNRGKHSCTIPSSVRAGDYLLRAEVIGLHEGEVSYTQNSARGAQFYPSCTQIRLTSGGSSSLPGGVSFPGTYRANDPGITFNVYNNPTSYIIPGGSVWGGSGGGGGGGSTTSPPPTSTSPPTSGTVAKYGQCGGIGYTGPTTCASGSTCTKSNDYYSQCL